MPESATASFGTRAVHAGQTPDPTTGSRAVPIYQTTSFVFRDTEHAAKLFALEELGNIYTRIHNPTTDVVEARVASLEGGVWALAHSSGQAAITSAILNICQPGDNIVSQSQLYGGTYNLFKYTLPKMGISVKFVDGEQPTQFAEAIDAKTKAIYGDSQGNPRMNIFTYEEAAQAAREAKIPLIIDNTALSPAVCRPIEHGANVVINSLTKYIGGHGAAIGGIVVDAGNFDWGSGIFPMFTEPDPSYHGLVHWDAFQSFEPFGGANIAYVMKMRLQLMRDTGNCPSPFNSWVHLLGLETLHLRMQRHCENALRVAEFLKTHPKVSWVNFPGLPDNSEHAKAKKYHDSGMYGALVGFGVDGGKAAGSRFIEALKLFSHLANIGDAKSLAIHPATTTHQQLEAADLATTGVTDDFVRLSVGIEDSGDILADLDQALAAV